MGVGSSQHCWRQQAVSSAVEERGAQCHTAMTTVTTTLLLLAGLSHSHSQAYRGRWGFRSSWNNFRSPFSLPRPEPEPEPFRRRIFSPTFSSPFAEPEPEPEPSSRARFGGSFSRRFFDARVRTPVVSARPTVAPATTAGVEV